MSERAWSLMTKTRKGDRLQTADGRVFQFEQRITAREIKHAYPVFTHE